jgi:putative chitinase
MALTHNRLQLVMPKAPWRWLTVMIEEMPKWGVDTTSEIASFVAQVAHESNELTRLAENLNYSADRLMQVWPRRFTTLDVARPYAHKPEELANLVYANRLGNGDPASGDGWRFRGRGPIQITGRTNYRDCGAGIGVDLLAQPELLFQPYHGIRSALWYWKSRGLDRLDDDDDVRAETRLINGGEHGLARRQAYFDRCLVVLLN